MSKRELLSEIEYLRHTMINLANCSSDYTTILEVSQELDELIVMYHKHYSRP